MIFFSASSKRDDASVVTTFCRTQKWTSKADEAKKASDDIGAKAGSSDLAKDAGAIASTSAARTHNTGGDAVASTKRRFAPNIKKAMPASGRKRQTRSAETTASSDRAQVY